jgi:hypothetical protein
MARWEKGTGPFLESMRCKSEETFPKKTTNWIQTAKPFNPAQEANAASFVPSAKPTASA